MEAAVPRTPAGRPATAASSRSPIKKFENTKNSQNQTPKGSPQRAQSAASTRPPLAHYSGGTPDARTYTGLVVDTKPLSRPHTAFSHRTGHSRGPSPVPLDLPPSPEFLDDGTDVIPNVSSPTNASEESIKLVMNVAADAVRAKKRRDVVNRSKASKVLDERITYKEIVKATKGTSHELFPEWFIRKGKDEKKNNRVANITLTQLNKMLHESSSVKRRVSRETTTPSLNAHPASYPYSPGSGSPLAGSPLKSPVYRPRNWTPDPPLNPKRQSPKNVKPKSREPLWSPGQTRTHEQWERPPNPAMAWEKPRTAWQRQNQEMQPALTKLHQCGHKHVVRPDHQGIFCKLGSYPHGNHPHTKLRVQT